MSMRAAVRLYKVAQPWHSLHAARRSPLQSVSPVVRSFASSSRRKSQWKWTPIPIGVGIAFITFLQGRKIYRRQQKEKQSGGEASLAPEDNLLDDWTVQAIRVLPTRLGSRLWGSLCSLRLPTALREPLLGIYARQFGCNMEEAEVSDLAAYDCLQSLFCRRLKPGSRTISDAELVSPADCRVLHFGTLEGSPMEQIKGVTYPVESYLGQDLPAPKPGHKHFYSILYLAPGDYHHYHAPADWKQQQRRHFPGDLLSVAPVVFGAIRGLLALNERVVTVGEWAHGFFSFGAIGAYNVGSIHIDGDELATNSAKERNVGTVCYTIDNERSLKKGEHYGGFKLGSCVVLVFEAPEDFQFVISPHQKLKYGQALCKQKD